MNIYMYIYIDMCVYTRVHVCVCFCVHVRAWICLCVRTYVMKIFRTLRTGARFSSTFSRRSARERDFRQNFQDAPFSSKSIQDAPHGSAIFLKIFRKLRTGARFSSEFSRRSARERDFSQNFQDGPHGCAILIKRERS